MRLNSHTRLRPHNIEFKLSQRGGYTTLLPTSNLYQFIAFILKYKTFLKINSVVYTIP